MAVPSSRAHLRAANRWLVLCTSKGRAFLRGSERNPKPTAGERAASAVQTTSFDHLGELKQDFVPSNHMLSKEFCYNNTSTIVVRRASKQQV